jgi:tRNA (cytidine/uridine-2'-O-)-methyltransferase
MLHLLVSVHHYSRLALGSAQASRTRRSLVAFAPMEQTGASPPGDPPPPTMHVVLVHPEIAWNTGNAGRTCLAAGAQLHLVRPLGFSLEEREVRRAGVDYWPRVRPIVWQDWTELEARLGQLGEAFFFSAEAPVELWEVRFPPCPVLVFGPESGGLSDDIRRHFASRLICIPMADTKMRSLNLSTAVAIVAYEVLRQRRR